MNWDDLRILVAVAEAGSMDAAARDLKLSSHTVTNSISALERALNSKLVTRSADVVECTSSGQRAVAVAREIGVQIAALAAELGGVRGEVAGKLTVTSTAGFLSRAMKAFELLREKYPALEIGVNVSTQVVDLRRKEADLAVRMFRDEQPGFALDKLGTMGWSLYASARYLADRKTGPGLLDGHQVIAYDGGFSKTQGGRWLAANVPEDSIVLRVGGIRQALDAAAAHQGVCIVPCYLAVEDGLARVTDQVLTTTDVYAVYLAERRDEARLRVVIEALHELFAREQASFAGT